MNAGKIMTLQEADEDRRVARSAMRGILDRPSNLHAAGSAGLTTRGEGVAVSGRHPRGVGRCPVAVSQRGDRCGARRAAVERRRAAGTGRRGRQHGGYRRRLLHARPQLRVDRHGHIPCTRPRSLAWCATAAAAQHQRLLRRLCAEQLLLASSTTEGRAGGDVRNSSAPIEWRDSRITLERQATVISTPRAADGIVTTARRSPEAASSDQVLVAFPQGSDYALERLNRWGCVGMRGTCSVGFCALAPPGPSRARSCPEPYDRKSRQTIDAVRASGLERGLSGIAAAASISARAFVAQGDAASRGTACRRAGGT